MPARGVDELSSTAMRSDRFDVIDCDAGRAWRLDEESAALRYASARHAATGNVVEVVRVDGEAQHILVLPPSRPCARGWIARSSVHPRSRHGASAVEGGQLLAKLADDQQIRRDPSR